MIVSYRLIHHDATIDIYALAGYVFGIFRGEANSHTADVLRSLLSIQRGEGVYSEQKNVPGPFQFAISGHILPAVLCRTLLFLEVFVI